MRREQRSSDGAVVRRRDPWSPVRGALGDVRSFIDQDGTLWSVVERATDHLPHPLAQRVLQFDSAKCWRLVWHYPADWHRLSARELEALSHTR